MSGLLLEVGAVFPLQMGTNCSDVARPFVARIEDFCMPPMTLGRSVSGPKPAAQVFKKLKILVSAVRFRPRPPDIKPWISNDPGLFSGRCLGLPVRSGQSRPLATKAEWLAAVLARFRIVSIPFALRVAPPPFASIRLACRLPSAAAVKLAAFIVHGQAQERV